MPRRPPLGLLLAGVAVLVVLAVLLALRPQPPAERELGPLAVDGPEQLTDAEAAACGRLLEALPDDLGDGLVRRLTVGPGLTAAWGDPAVVLVCGVEPPERAEPPIGLGPPGGEPLLFTTRDVGRGTRFTTSDRAVRAFVELPDAYDAVPLQRLLPALAVLPEGRAPGAPAPEGPASVPPALPTAAPSG